MPPVRRPLAGIAALGAAALIAGCGGGSDSLERRRVPPAGRRDLRRRQRAPRHAHRADPGPAVLPFLQEGLTIQAEELGAHPGARSAGRPPGGLRRGDRPAASSARRLIQQAADRIEAGEDPEAVIQEASPEIARLQRRGAGEGERAGAHGLRRRRRRGGHRGDGDHGARDDGRRRRAAGRRGPRRPRRDRPVRRGRRRGGGVAAELLQPPSGHDEPRGPAGAGSPRRRAELDSFDDGASPSSRATPSTTPRSRRQRAELAESGPQVSDRAAAVPRRPPRSGDAEAIQAVLPERDPGPHGVPAGRHALRPAASAGGGPPAGARAPSAWRRRSRPSPGSPRRPRT